LTGCHTTPSLQDPGKISKHSGVVRFAWVCTALTAYTVSVQQALDATQTDPELLGHLSSCDAGPVKINHHLKILRGKAIMQTS
jgi:hypothetical protein